MIAVFLAVLMYGFSVDTSVMSDPKCMTDTECMAYCAATDADCDGGPQ